MSDTEPATPAEALNRNIQAELVRKGRKRVELEAGIGISHAYAARRFNGEFAWRPSEVKRIAEWLDVEPDSLLPGGAWSWDLAVALEGGR